METAWSASFLPHAAIELARWRIAALDPERLSNRGKMRVEEREHRLPFHGFGSLFGKCGPHPRRSGPLGTTSVGQSAPEFAELAEAEALDIVPIRDVRDRGVRQARGVMRADVCVLGVVGAQLVAIEHRVGEDLAHARRQLQNLLKEHVPCAPGPWIDDVLVEHQAACLGALARLEALLLGALPREHQHRQTELLRQVQIDLVEVSPGLHDVHVRVHVGDVDTRGERRLELGPAESVRHDQIDAVGMTVRVSTLSPFVDPAEAVEAVDAPLVCLGQRGCDRGRFQPLERGLQALIVTRASAAADEGQDLVGRRRHEPIRVALESVLD